MFYLGAGLGLFVGVAIGIVVIALCRAARWEEEDRVEYRSYRYTGKDTDGVS
jgi:hypothetical protein